GLEDTATDPDAIGKASERSALVRGWLAEPAFRHWYDVWMSMPDCVVDGPDGKPRAIAPAGTPPAVPGRMQGIARVSNIGLTTRALDVTTRIQKAFPGLDPDPASESWHKARPRLVEMLGEKQVEKYETERMGKQSEGDRKEMTKRLDQLLAPGELGRLKALL